MNIKILKTKNFKIFLFILIFINLLTNLSYLINDKQQVSVNMSSADQAIIDMQKSFTNKISSTLKPYHFPPFMKHINLNHNHNLGAEHYAIAKSIADGEGFSSPFILKTGPTSWMPPLHPYILSAFILIFKDKLTLSFIMATIKLIVYAFVVFFCISLAKKTGNIDSKIIYFTFFAWSLSYFTWFYQQTNEAWLDHLILISVYSIILFHWRDPKNATRYPLAGFISGLAALSHPVIAAAGCLQLLIFFWKKKLIKTGVINLGVMLLVLSPWIIRNYVVFDKFIPVKSNLFYDLYIANYENSDGILKNSENEDHPYLVLPFNRPHLYTQVDEVTFMKRYKEKLKSALKKDPWRYIKNIKNRFIAIFFDLPYYYDFVEHGFIKRLIDRLIYFCPTIGIFFILFRQKQLGFNSPERLVAVSFVITYLLFYTFTSYYFRYQLPLLTFKIMLIYWGIESYKQLYDKFKLENPPT